MDGAENGYGIGDETGMGRFAVTVGIVQRQGSWSGYEVEDRIGAGVGIRDSAEIEIMMTEDGVGTGDGLTSAM